MSDLTKEIEFCVSFVRASLEVMEQQAAAGKETHAEILQALKAMMSASMHQGIPPRDKDHKKQPRGLGYEFEEALIVASLPEHGGDLSKAIADHYKDMPESSRSDGKDAKAQFLDATRRRIIRHTRPIEEFEAPPPKSDALKLFEKILTFPHATRDIAGHVAEEFEKFGRDDARRRGISDDDWIWKRSRALAGFK